MNVIYVADVDRAGARSRGIWGHSFATAEACVLLINRREIRGSAALFDAAVGALDLRADRSSVRMQTDPGAPGVQMTGPFRAAAADPNVVSLSYRPGWSAEQVAASAQPWHSGMGGPHAVELLVDLDRCTDPASALQALVQGARLALKEELDD